MHMRAGRKKLPYGQPARCAEARFAGFDREGRCIMKRLTAALLAIALILTACAAPAGSSGGGPAPSESTDGGSGAPSESTDGGSGAAYEGRTDGQSPAESGEGFVTAQESREPFVPDPYAAGYHDERHSFLGRNLQDPGNPVGCLLQVGLIMRDDQAPPDTLGNPEVLFLLLGNLVSHGKQFPAHFVSLTNDHGGSPLFYSEPVYVS